MTVSTYLSSVAGNAIIRDSEKESIQSSINTIDARLKAYFGRDVIEKFKFGSYTRNTILPRSMDEHSDIDYMVVFKDDGSTPQTYLNRLKKFVEKYYYSSEIKQSFPTVQLKLGHIMFELVPALKKESFLLFDNGYQIPERSGQNSWIDTDPNDFNSKLTEKNTEHSSVIKPLVRLVKYWNAQNGYIFESYALERSIVNHEFSLGFFESPDLKKYLYQFFQEMGTWQLKYENSKKAIARANSIIREVKDLEDQNMPISAEDKIKKLIPDPNNSTKSLNVGRQTLLGAALTKK